MAGRSYNEKTLTTSKADTAVADTTFGQSSSRTDTDKMN